MPNSGVSASMPKLADLKLPRRTSLAGSDPLWITVQIIPVINPSVLTEPFLKAAADDDIRRHTRDEEL